MPSREVLNESISRSDWKENVFGSELRGGKNSHQTACGLSSSQTGLESLSFIKKKAKLLSVEKTSIWIPGEGRVHECATCA